MKVYIVFKIIHIEDPEDIGTPDEIFKKFIAVCATKEAAEKVAAKYRKIIEIEEHEVEQ